MHERYINSLIIIIIIVIVIIIIIIIIIIRKFHSKAAKRKAEDTAELLGMELIHSNKVPNIDSQLGGAMTTRGMKRVTNEEDNKSDVKVPKPEDTDPTSEPTDEYVEA